MMASYLTPNKCHNVTDNGLECLNILMPGDNFCSKCGQKNSHAQQAPQASETQGDGQQPCILMSPNNPLQDAATTLGDQQQGKDECLAAGLPTIPDVVPKIPKEQSPHLPPKTVNRKKPDRPEVRERTSNVRPPHPSPRPQTVRERPVPAPRSKSCAVTTELPGTSTTYQRNNSWSGKTREEDNDSSESDYDQEPYITMQLPTQSPDEDAHHPEITDEVEDENTCEIYENIEFPLQVTRVTFKVWLDKGIPFDAKNDHINLCIAEQRRNMVCKGRDATTHLLEFTLTAPIPMSKMKAGILYGYEIHTQTAHIREDLTFGTKNVNRCLVADESILKYYEDGKKRLSLALALVFTISRFTIPLSKNDALILCCALLIKPKLPTSRSYPEEVEAVRQLYKVIGVEQIVGSLEKYLFLVCGKKLCEPMWVLAVPLCHLVAPDSEHDDTVNVTSEAWWGIKNLDKPIKAYQKKHPKSEHFPKLAMYLDPLVQLDVHLTRTLLSILSLENLTQPNSVFFPLEVIFAGVCNSKMHGKLTNKRADTAIAIMRHNLAKEQEEFSENANNHTRQMNILHKSNQRAMLLIQTLNVLDTIDDTSFLLVSYTFVMDCFNTTRQGLQCLQQSTECSQERKEQMSQIHTQYRSKWSEIEIMLPEVVTKKEEIIKQTIHTASKQMLAAITEVIEAIWSHLPQNDILLHDLTSGYWTIMRLLAVLKEYKHHLPENTQLTKQKIISATNPLVNTVMSPTNLQEVEFINRNRGNLCYFLHVVKDLDALACDIVFDSVRQRLSKDTS